MPSTASNRISHRPTVLGASLGALVLALAACSSSSPAESAGGGASQGGAARCEVTAGATAAATNTITSSNFGDAVTISAGEAVTFTNNDSFAHTVTEGTDALHATTLRGATTATLSESLAMRGTQLARTERW